MRVGPHGLLQPIADGIKLFKEDIIPAEADKTVFKIAPIAPVFAALSALAVIPFFEGLRHCRHQHRVALHPCNVVLGAYGIVMAGRRTPHSFLGGCGRRPR